MIQKTTMSLCALLMLFAFGCGKPQASRQNQSLLASLRTATSTRSTQLLEDNAKRIEDRHAAGEMCGEVHEQLKKIIDLAKAGQWKEADKEAHAMMKAQDHSDPGDTHRHEAGQCSDHSHAH